MYFNLFLQWLIKDLIERKFSWMFCNKTASSTHTVMTELIAYKCVIYHLQALCVCMEWSVWGKDDSRRPDRSWRLPALGLSAPWWPEHSSHRNSNSWHRAHHHLQKQPNCQQKPLTQSQRQHRIRQISLHRRGKPSKYIDTDVCLHTSFGYPRPSQFIRNLRSFMPYVCTDMEL